MASQLTVTIVFNGKEISNSLDPATIETVAEAEKIVNEAIETFIQRYKLNDLLAQKVRKESYWNKEEFLQMNGEDKYSLTHSKEIYELFQRYLNESHMEKAQAVRLAKENIANYYQLITDLEHEGYARDVAKQIVDNSPRRKERLEFAVMVLGDKGYPKHQQEIAELKGFYA